MLFNPIMEPRTDIKQISKKTGNYIKEYCSNIPPLASSFSLFEQISSDKVSFAYSFYPYLFNHSFHFLNDKKLLDLSLAGFLLYRSIIAKDFLIDNINTNGKETFIRNDQLLLIKDICQEEAYRLLIQLFSTKSEFWDYWNLRRSEYLEAIELDKQLINQPFNQNGYEKLADFKSAFAKLAIDALHILSGKKYTTEYELLIRSHELFSVGVQIYDDINDLKEDYINGQFNWCISHLIDKIGNEKFEIEKKIKLIFVNGVAQNAYQESLNYFNQAIEVVNGINCSNWINGINMRIQMTADALSVLNDYFNELKSAIKIGVIA